MIDLRLHADDDTFLIQTEYVPRTNSIINITTSYGNLRKFIVIRIEYPIRLTRENISQNRVHIYLQEVFE